MIGLRTLTRVAALGAALVFGAASAYADGNSGTLVEWGGAAGTYGAPPAGDDFVAISAGYNWATALRADGSLAAWGEDLYGEVSATPSGTGFVAVSLSDYAGYALRGDGTVTRWGYGNAHLSGSDFVAVSAGALHVIGLRSDGSLVAAAEDSFGDFYGQVTATPSGTGFVAVAGGGFHNVAIRADGSLVSWGFDDYGQVSGTPSGTDYVAVAAGRFHNIALRADGSLVAWGYNSGALVSDTPTGGGFVSVAAGGLQSVALRANGHLVTWGAYEESAPEGTFLAIAAGYQSAYAILLGPPLSVAEMIQELDEAVQDLVEEGASLPANGIVLRTSLRLAERFAYHERYEPAVLMLEVFVMHVERYVRQGRLSAGEGDDLIEAAEEVIFLLED
jgi:alpha-tubulin suppressor-like RCC1 family protein